MVTPNDRSERNAIAIDGARKAAILLITLGSEISSTIMRHLDEEEIQRIGREMARAHAIPAEQSEQVLDEFYNMQLAHEYVLKGGVDYARRVLIEAFGPEQGQRIIERMLKQLGGENLSFDIIAKADPQQLAKFIHNEHPQTIALILSHLSSEQAAGLLFWLPPDLRADVSLRMAQLDQISPDIIGKIANIIGVRLKEMGEVSRESAGGVKAVAEMLNRLDSSTSKDVLESLESAESSLVEQIRHLMFVFEDLLLLDSNGVKELLGRVDRKLLTVALKGTSEKLRQHFMSAMSQRGADMLREDMEAMGPVKIKEVETAQQQIISIVRQLESEGAISLKGSVGEQYVV
jgi:flagellar motor switch protein FliG